MLGVEEEKKKKTRMRYLLPDYYHEKKRQSILLNSMNFSGIVFAVVVTTMYFISPFNKWCEPLLS